jgi:hypothetical protein
MFVFAPFAPLQRFFTSTLRSVQNVKEQRQKVLFVPFDNAKVRLFLYIPKFLAKKITKK